MALGASRQTVLLRIVRYALTIAATGVAAGLIASVGLTHFLAGMLYEVKPLDGLTIASAVLVLLGCSALAAFGPARRAASIEPMQTLRSE
jgi:ABC-type antimicrobial peptide transport system permease subunit